MTNYQITVDITCDVSQQKVIVLSAEEHIQEILYCIPTLSLIFLCFVLAYKEKMKFILHVSEFILNAAL